MEKRLRICLLSYRSNPHCGGQGVYLKFLSKALKDLGHHVEIITGPPDPDIDPDIPVHRIPCLDLYNPENPFRVPSIRELKNPVNLVEWVGVSSMGFPEPFTFGIRAYRFLKSRFRDFDIVHDNQSLSYGVWAMGKSIPTIATIHHPITVDRSIAVSSASGFVKKLQQFRWHSFISMQKKVAGAFPSIITVSKAAMNDIARDFAVSGERFRVVANGIDTDLFRPIPDIPREPGRIIVTNSADVPLKGLAYLLKATAKIIPHRSIRLIVVGTPKKNGVIEKLVRELGIGAHVRFTGRISDEEFVEQYARSSIAVIPSVYEGFGLPAGEAMACGVPVVSTTGGALPEVVGDAGLLVPPADTDALVSAIGKLLDNPEFAAKTGYEGFIRVNERFTWKRAAQKTVEAYEEVIRDYH